MKSWTLYQHSIDAPKTTSNFRAELADLKKSNVIIERSLSSQSHIQHKSKKLFQFVPHQPDVPSIVEDVDEDESIIYLPKDVTPKDWAKREITRRNVQLREIPFQTINLSQLVRRYQLWKQFLPSVHPHYAVKVNDHPLILKTLAKLGCGFDCATEGEIKKILKIGVSSHRIIYAHTTKPVSHIRYAQHAGVNLCTFDTPEELEKIKKWHPNMKLILRIAVKNPFTDVPFDTKFGCLPEDVESLLDKSAELGLPVVGVSFHIGSYSCSGSPYALGIRQAKVAFELGKTHGHPDMSILDIGGGFPGDTDSTTFQQFTNEVKNALEEYFGNVKNLRVVAEPGTFFAKSPTTLYTSIVGRKLAKLSAEEKHENRSTGSTAPDLQRVYYLSTGVYGPFMDHFVSIAVTYLPSDFITQKELDRESLYQSRVFGPTCDPLDEINHDCLLPELGLGDWLEYSDEGAYTLPFLSEFNSFPAPDTFLLVEHKHRKYFEKHIQKQTAEE